MFSGCDNEELLSEMASSRLLIVLKGTYASNSPRPWVTYAMENPYSDIVQDDSVVDCSTDPGGGNSDVFPSFFMLDLAEMKLGIDDKYPFSKYRQTQAINLSDGHPFFNGAGIILESDDVPSSGYFFIGLYIRKMLFDNAKRFAADTNGWISSYITDIFQEMDVPGFNFNQYNVNSKYDTLRFEGTLSNRVFPLIVPIEGGLLFHNSLPYTVLEIRLIVKNYIKKYESESYNGMIYNANHFYAFSDWLEDVKEDETSLGGESNHCGEGLYSGCDRNY